MTIDISHHPCFNEKIRHKYGRIHLPVAPKCNIQCNFCNRKYDCVNESRPGVTSGILSPYQALYYLEESLKKDSSLSVVGIAGPGDPFANGEKTMSTLRLVRKKFPAMILCVATNGLDILPFVDELAALEVSHISITVNALENEIGKNIYSWVRYNKKMYRGRDAASVLLERQLEAIKEIKRSGITVKINTIIIPGVNTGHISDVAKKMSELGVDIFNCLPLCRNPDTPFEHIAEPDKALIESIRKEAKAYIPQMHHCTRCRADAAGLLGEDNIGETIGRVQNCASLPLNPYEKSPYVAVTSREGALVNQHLGEAHRFFIYDKKDECFELIDERIAPHPGTGERWENLAEILGDCAAVLTSRAGDSPRKILEKKNIRVLAFEGIIEEGLEAVYEGRSDEYFKKFKPCVKSFCNSSSCS